jgi:hypothetical protein
VIDPTIGGEYSIAAKEYLDEMGSDFDVNNDIF